jgi:hypothetical protein
MSLAASRIITKGLGGRACDGIITTHFSLYCESRPIVIDRGSGGIGGGTPSKFSPVANPTVNNDNPMPYNIDRDRDEDEGPGRQHLIIMRMKIGKQHFRREYTVPEARQQKVAKVLKVVNRTKDKVNVAVHNVRNTLKEAAEALKNLLR